MNPFNLKALSESTMDDIRNIFDATKRMKERLLDIGNRLEEAIQENQRLKDELRDAQEQVTAMEKENACLKESNEALGKGFWPPAFLDSPLAEIRNEVAADLAKPVPMPEAQGMVGSVYRLFSGIGHLADSCEAFADAYYAWCNARENSNDVLARRNRIAEWLNVKLQQVQISVQVVEVGDAISDNIYNREGMGVVVKAVHSFLFVRKDGTTYRKATVST